MEYRAPAVAGRFYPANSALLEREAAALTRPGRSPSPAIAAVVPHAGYIYSGAIAGETLAAVSPPVRALLMAPNHTGLGANQALFPGRGFRLPGQTVEVDDELCQALRQGTTVVDDAEAHALEHAVEVELPLLRALNSELRVAALCLGRLPLRQCAELGGQIATALQHAGLAASTLLVASSDMSHYVSAETARSLDGLAIERILALDAEGLYRVVTEREISMCGFVPTTVMLFAARALGASSAELIRYGNSGERSGDFERVVGYAGVVVR